MVEGVQALLVEVAQAKTGQLPPSPRRSAMRSGAAPGVAGQTAPQGPDTTGPSGLRAFGEVHALDDTTPLPATVGRIALACERVDTRKDMPPPPPSQAQSGELKGSLTTRRQETRARRSRR